MRRFITVFDGNDMIVVNINHITKILANKKEGAYIFFNGEEKPKWHLSYAEYERQLEPFLGVKKDSPDSIAEKYKQVPGASINKPMGVTGKFVGKDSLTGDDYECQLPKDKRTHFYDSMAPNIHDPNAAIHYKNLYQLTNQSLENTEINLKSCSHERDKLKSELKDEKDLTDELRRMLNLAEAKKNTAVDALNYEKERLKRADQVEYSLNAQIEVYKEQARNYQKQLDSNNTFINKLKEENSKLEKQIEELKADRNKFQQMADQYIGYYNTTKEELHKFKNLSSFSVLMQEHNQLKDDHERVLQELANTQADHLKCLRELDQIKTANEQRVYVLKEPLTEIPPCLPECANCRSTNILHKLAKDRKEFRCQDCGFVEVI